MKKDTPQGRKQPEDRDDWESLAEDLFGIDFQTSPPEPVEDDLLDDLPLPPVPAEPAEAVSGAAAQDEAEEPETAFGETDADDDGRTSDAETVAAAAAFDDSAETPSPDEFPDADEGPQDSAADDDVDDFWSGLDLFAPDELSTPEAAFQTGEEPVDEQKIGPRPMRSGPVTDVPVTRTEFVEDDEFGLGVLEDVEVDDDEDEVIAAPQEAAEKATSGETPKRKRARRRRRGRGKSSSERPASLEERAADDGPSPDIAATARAAADSPEPLAIDADDDEDDDDDERGATGEAHPGYTNIPTWAQAISYLTKRGGETAAPDAGPAESSSGKKSRSRGRRRGSGRRRRKRPDSSAKSDPGS